MNKRVDSPNLIRRGRNWFVFGIVFLFAGFGAGSAFAAPTAMVDLGQASTYAVISGASVGNTVSAPGAAHTTIRGDLGVKANTAPSGFPPGVVTGTIRFGSTVDQAHADVVAAYVDIASRTGGTPLPGAMAGATVLPGLHTITGAASNTGTLTLDAAGDPDAVFVFQVGGALSFAAASHVVLANGARASRVFWQVNGAGAVGALADFAGTMIAMDAVAMGNGTFVNGRAFARNGAMTLDNNQFYSAPPVVTIDGGVSAQTTDTTPTVSGTTDVESPATVSVTIAGQTLVATPTAGTWSVTSAILANGTYPVVAAVTDGAGNPGSASQQLTVDTVPPVITLDGGTEVTTGDATPTIGGTTDVAVGTVVRVTVAAQNLNALVQAGGSWNVTPAPLGDAIHTVTAAVTDPAGNESTATQSLTVDTTAPSLSITGGPSRLTNDATPEITGSAEVDSGTSVTVTVGNETLTGPVGPDESWSVDAATLPQGPHRIVAKVSDTAGNETSAEQILTVDTVLPIVTINGGETATTDRTDPTIAGTSDLAPGSTVTVTIANGSLTTLVQANGSWNTNAGAVGNGTWEVVASAQDPAGNVGSARQTLTIGPAVIPTSFRLTVSKNGNGTGEIRSSPAGAEFDYGTTVTLTARPATGSSFAGWGGACSGTRSCVVKMDQARRISARFADRSPEVTGLRVTPGRVPLLGRRPAASRHRSPAIRLKVSENSIVRISLSRRSTRTRTFQVRKRSGSGYVPIPLKIRRQMKPGRYVVTVVATDSVGQKSRPARTAFRVVR